VGYVGQGTGGDFRRTLGIEHRLDAYVEAIASGRERKVDVGKLRYRTASGEERSRWFVNILSAGMGGLVDRYVSQSSRVLGSSAAYFWASLRALSACPRARLKCDVVDRGAREERRFPSLMIAICNGGYFGSGMQIAPMAKVDDGRFEVVSLDAPNKLAFMVFSRSVYSGRHLTHPGARHFSCDEIGLDLENEEARQRFLLDVDGEPLGGLPLHVSLVPRALTLRG
jgi:diacylglycerol kinase family enzyme